MLRLIRNILKSRNDRPKAAPRPRPSIRPTLEALETRALMSANVLQTNLVSDLPGVAAVQDPNLVNPWGISEGGAGPFWISDNNAGVSTLYNTPGPNNTPIGINPLVVSIPTPGDPAGSRGAPSGTVFNIDLAGKGFQVTDGTHTGPAIFLFATEDGTILGWNPTVDPTGKFDGPNHASTHAVIAVDNSTSPTAADGAVYKGLAVGTDANGRTLLYASDFRHGTVDVFDTNFKPVTTLAAGAFTDPHLPKGYAPFNVQVLNGQLYVTYAKQNKDKHDDVGGEGHGFVDVFNLDGTPGLAGGKVRLVSRGELDSPWGLAIAPQGFAGITAPNNDAVLLVGNFRDGHINIFDAKTGTSLGQLKDPDGEPVQIDGLWALKVGNGHGGGDASTVYFTAGIFHESHGLFGSFTTAAPGSAEGPAEAQAITADIDVVQLDLQTLLKDESAGASKATIRQDVRNLDAALVRLGRDEIRFTADALTDLGIGRNHDHDDARRDWDDFS
jgi:uncharacterized protein (TIGR03118 family)